MRGFSIFIILSFCVVVSGFSQTGGLKGPAAKNYKPWKNPRPATPIVIATLDQDIKGPKAKNMRPLQRTDTTTIVDTTVPKKRLMGPAYKNRKPWRKERDD